MITKEEYVEFLNAHKRLLHRDEPIKLNTGFWRVSYSICRCHGIGESLNKTKADEKALDDLVNDLMSSNITPFELDMIYITGFQ